MPKGVFVRSLEHNANISKALAGRACSAETRAKIAAALRGRRLSPEHRSEISAALIGNAYAKGTVHSPETRAAWSAMQTRHGHTVRGAPRSRTYNSWASMWQRCTNPRATGFGYYGGRGITVTDRWQTFENFLADMGERPAGKTLDRRDNAGNYEPGNCRWATPKAQLLNRRALRLEEAA